MRKFKRIRIVRPGVVVQIRGFRGFCAFLLGAIRCGIRVFKIVPTIWGCETKPIYVIAWPKYQLEAMPDDV